MAIKQKCSFKVAYVQDSSETESRSSYLKFKIFMTIFYLRYARSDTVMPRISFPLFHAQGLILNILIKRYK